MIDVLASQPHYVDHLAPVWLALAPELRGRFQVPGRLADRVLAAGIAPSLSGPPFDRVLVAGGGDVAIAHRMRARAIARMEHGVGQSYAGDRRWARHPSYPGGRGQEAVSLFLAPNEQAAARWRRAYPAAQVEVIGATRVLPRPKAEQPIVGVSFHWDGPIPEARSAWAYYRDAVEALASGHAVLGHAHPRAAAHLERWYQSKVITFVPELADLAIRATVYVTDNSSSLYEMAVHRPVVALDAPWYRRDIDHGLRFWDLVPGPRVERPEDLEPVVLQLLTGEPADVWEHRQHVIAKVIPHADGASRAATYLMAWCRQRAAVAA